MRTDSRAATTQLNYASVAFISARWVFWGPCVHATAGWGGERERHNYAPAPPALHIAQILNGTRPCSNMHTFVHVHTCTHTPVLHKGISATLTVTIAVVRVAPFAPARQ
ncbi:unnamed protein product, partial [Scytosiphon promiscuus]